MSNAQRARRPVAPTAPVGTAPSSVDAIVVLPYTRVRRSGGQPTYRMSHFTARCILAGLELYRRGVAARFILPGEQRAPATSDLEQAYLVRRGVGNESVVNLPNLNGTLEQLEAVARLQQRGNSAPLLFSASGFTPTACAATCACWPYGASRLQWSTSTSSSCGTTSVRYA